MTGNKSLDKFLDFFTSNASAVFTTITNQEINISVKNFTDFSVAEITNTVNVPCVLATANFKGQKDFLMHVIVSKDTVATMADLMMLGTGDAEYIPEEHNDALQEIFNQSLGSLTTELDAEGVAANGSVSEVTLSDMEIHSEFLTGNKMVTLSYQLLGKEVLMHLLFDNQSMDTLNGLFSPGGGGSQATPASAPSSGGGGKQVSNDPVSVSRASFAEIQEVRPSVTKPANIDILLDINLPITVELGRKDMRIKEILELGQGSVLELTKLAGDLVDLMINGKKFAVGEVMVVDENYAVRIVSLISREERIRTLGPE